jgi:hypothetical protein
MAKLKVGDVVLWRGDFGSAPKRKAKIESLQVVEPGEKYGDEVAEIDWKLVPNRCVASLDNGHWAYGSQISPYC